MLGVADSAEMFPFSPGVCQILLLSNPTAFSQPAVGLGLNLSKLSRCPLCLLRSGQVYSFTTLPPIAESVKLLHIWHQNYTSDRRIRGQLWL